MWSDERSNDCFCYTIITSLIVFFSIVSISVAFESTHKFSDPTREFELSEEWRQQSITYTKESEGADLVVTLNQHFYPAFKGIIETFAKVNSLDIRVSKGTCGISAGMNKDKSADISGFCCPAGETDRLPGLRFYTIGIAAVKILVHKDNPIENVTSDEVRKIFSGEITNWSSLKRPNGEAGPNLFIKPIGRLHCKSRPGHWKLILENDEMFSVSLQEVGSIEELLHAVAANQGAVGFEAGWMMKEYGYEDKLKSLKIDGVDPGSMEDIASNRYPFYRVYSITVWDGEGVEKHNAKKLLDYILQHSKSIDPKYEIIDRSHLVNNGWGFYNSELIKEPNSR